mmetsp:Transcript_6433/g.24251  ORF Transcript_6433/g.24251 Transcript_6433/m.24251 type:complete len:326 (-) Transcript_6433:19-996(-)
MFRIRSSTTVDATGSKPAVGSSYITTSSSCSSMSKNSPSHLDAIPGTDSLIIALASAARFFIPPESCAGYRSSCPERPTESRLCFIKPLITTSGRSLCSYSLNPTFSPTVRESKSAALWKTIPTLSRGFFSSLSSPSLFSPRMKTSPESGASRPAMILKMVLLPVPLLPIIPTASPLLILKLAPFSTAFFPKLFVTFLSSIRTSASTGSVYALPGVPPAPEATGFVLSAIALLGGLTLEKVIRGFEANEIPGSRMKRTRFPPDDAAPLASPLCVFSLAKVLPRGPANAARPEKALDKGIARTTEPRRPGRVSRRALGRPPGGDWV